LRTLSRCSTQLTSAIQAPVWPELSRAHGASDRVLSRKLHRYSCQASLWISGGIAIVLALGGSRILAVWTHGKIVMDMPSFALLLAAGVVNSLWSSSMMALLATNEHGRVALFYLIVTSVSLPAACLLMLHIKLPGAAAAMFGAEALCCAYVVKHSLALLGDSPKLFGSSLFRIPPVRSILLRRLRGSNA
jgi:O-antigen/teichoic acid export membrane protein